MRASTGRTQVWGTTRQSRHFTCAPVHRTSYVQYGATTPYGSTSLIGAWLIGGAQMAAMLTSIIIEHDRILGPVHKVPYVHCRVPKTGFKDQPATGVPSGLRRAVEGLGNGSAGMAGPLFGVMRLPTKHWRSSQSAGHAAYRMICQPPSFVYSTKMNR